MNCERLVLVGDAHLGRCASDVERAFLHFLDAVPRLGDGLLLIGDIFEFWFAYGRVIPRHGVRVVASLAELARRMPVAMVGGNHDRWAGTFWQDELGIQFSPGELAFTLCGRQAVAVHGDGLTESRWTSRFLHRLLRHPGTVAAYRAVHPDLGMWFVDRLSGYLGDRPRSEPEIQAASATQAAWARTRLEANESLALIAMGHTHRSAALEVAPGRFYLNPGAWFDGYRYATLAHGRAMLAQFTPPS